MSDKKTFQILKRPLITEKSTLQKETNNTLSFEVDRRANKHEIKAAVEQMLKVTVLDVRTLMVRGHMRRMGRHKITTSDWKKAVVTIKPGQRVEFFEGA